MLRSTLIPLVAVLTLGLARSFAKITSTWPTEHSGQPSGDYSSEWQTYFQVTDSLPGIDFDLPNNYAGNINVNRIGHLNDTLFFWGFEHAEGSLTAAAGDDDSVPWAIWLQGGPGSSSLNGLMTQNGPIKVVVGEDSKLTKNDHAWSNLIDYIWVEQPVGAGFSTAEADGFVVDEDQVGTDFVAFLRNLVKVFPSLATRPFYLTGQSYAGRFIPYIVKALFSDPNPPVKLAVMMVGDPAFGSNAEFKVMPTLRLIETYPQLIGYDTDVYDYFKTQTHLCGLDLNLSYPQTGGHFASINLTTGALPASRTTNDSDTNPDKNKGRHNTRGLLGEVAARFLERLEDGTLPLRQEERHRKRGLWKRDLSGRSNTSVDPYYGCDVWDEMIDFALNYTYPWTAFGDFDTFNTPDDLNPEPADDPTFFFTNSKVIKALHAPKDVTWATSINYPWNSQHSGGDPSPEPMAFFTELATNATKNDVRIITYVGNDDGISPHFGTEVTIQNTTFGGIQGFTRQPSTPWWSDSGEWAGIVHQERNWTYVLFYGAGHQVPMNKPVAAYTFLREFVIGNNQTGLVTTTNDTPTVVGGENPTLQQNAILGKAEIVYGSSTTEGSTAWPTATVAAFQSYIDAVAITGTSAIQPRETSGAGRGGTASLSVLLAVVVPLILSVV